MIKKIAFLFLLFCNLSFAQKQFVEKKYNTEYENDYKEVTINTGKPVFVVVYISNFIPNDSLIAVREFNELKKNFKGSNFYFLTKKGKIKINNSSKEVLDFDEINSSYEKILYWNGKKESEIVGYDKLIESSEYFSEILNLNKTSSYKDDYNTKINNFREQLVWEPSEKSQELSNKYLKNLLFEQLKTIEEFPEFLNLDFKGVKKLVVNSTLKGTKNPWQQINFNTEGLPTKAVVSTDDSDGKKGTVIYEYKDNLVSKITISFKSNGGEADQYVTDIYYSGSKLIAVVGSRVIFYTINSGFLTYKSYYMNEMNFEFLIDTYDLNNTELKYSESGGLNNYTISFNSKEKFFPVIYTLRPLTDKHTAVMSKTGELNYKVTREKTDYIKIKYLNKNLISEILMIDPDDITRKEKMNQYKFDFKYEYHK